jgi:hypothetical protein
MCFTTKMSSLSTCIHLVRRNESQNVDEMDIDVKTPAVYSVHSAIEELFESALAVSEDELCSPRAARDRRSPRSQWCKSWRIMSKLQSKWPREKGIEYGKSQVYPFSIMNSYLSEVVFEASIIGYVHSFYKIHSRQLTYYCDLEVESGEI